MKQWILPGVAFCILSGFLWREYTVSQLPVSLIFVEENMVLLRASEDHVFGMGRLDSSRAKAISRGILPFFTFGEISSVWEIPIGNEVKGKDFAVQRVSENLVRSVSFAQVMWWIGDEFDTQEQAVAVATGVSFQSDWWVMGKNRLPKFLPLPREGILYAGDRTPSKKTTTFAQEKEIPLLSVKDTGGFMLSFLSDGWELKVRD